MTIQVIRYHTLQPGPTLLLLGAVHGNETCGAHAIKHLNALLDNARVHLTAGTLITVPIANPKAYATHQRFCERNLNRQLYPKATCTYYEDHLTPILCPLLAEADCVLDLHSYTSQGGPFIFLGGNNSQETTYARALGVNHFIYGWQDAYNKAVGNTNETYQAHLESMGITEYARAKGALAITLECGHHHNTNATAIGLSAALNALQHFDMLRVDNPETILLGEGDTAFQLDLRTFQSSVAACPSDPSQQICLRMRRAYYKKKPGQFAQNWQHFDAVRTGEPLVLFDDGEHLLAEEDGFIVLPKPTADLGGEWFYFGVKSAFP